jgi:hypothetical protein
MNVAAARVALADALSTVDGVSVQPYTVKTPRVGDGWTTIVRAVPDGFTTTAATLVAFVVLGPDEVAAEKKADALMVPLLDAASGLGGDVLAESVTVVVGTNSTPLYALTITLTMEVE